MPNADTELFTALLIEAPKVLKPKHQQKLFSAMVDNLMERIPANGVGPVVAARRDAVQILACAIRLLKL